MTKYFAFIAWAIYMFVLAAHAQDKRVVDSLQLVLQNQSGGDRFPALYEMAFEYIKKDNERALALIQQAEEAALMSGDSLWIVKSRRVKGQLLYIFEEHDKAKETLFEALPVAVRNSWTQEQLLITNMLGHLELFVGKYDKALKYYFESHSLVSSLKDTVYLADVFHHIGISYYKLKDYGKALNYYLKAVQLLEHNPQLSKHVFANIGLCYAYTGDLYKARLSVNKNLSDCGFNCPDEIKVHVEYALGLISHMAKKYDSAELHFLTSYEVARKLGSTRFQFDNIFLLAKIYIDAQHYDKAEYLLLKAVQLINNGTHFNLEMIKIYSRLSELYVLRRDFKRASFYQSKYIQLRDSIYSEELTTNLMRTEADFLEQENKLRIASQERLIMLKEGIISRQEKLNFTICLLMLLTVVFLIFLFRSYRKNETLNALLEKKVKERTNELERNRNNLLTVVKNQEILLRRASSIMTDKINTLRGLCVTAHEEVSDPVALNYMQRINRTSGELGRCIHSVFGEDAFVVSHTPKNHG